MTPRARFASLALAGLLAVLAVDGCRKQPSAPPPFTVEESPARAPQATTAPPATDPATEAPPGGSFVGRWRGTLPCADCRGIDTELELFAGAGGISGPYHLVEVYGGKPEGRKRFESRGEWLAQRGTARDPAATVYRLEPAGGGEARFLLAVGDDLEALDRQAQPIASRANLRLRLVEDQHGPASGR